MDDLVVSYEIQYTESYLQSKLNERIKAKLVYFSKNLISSVYKQIHIMMIHEYASVICKQGNFSWRRTICNPEEKPQCHMCL